MEKKTASDVRAYLSTFEATYPIKKGYVARLILNEKLSIADICKKFKDIVDTAELGVQIHDRGLTASVYRFKKIAMKKVNYSYQWTDLLKTYQELFTVALKSEESDSATTSTVPGQPDHTFAPLIHPDHTFAPLIHPDHTCAPLIHPDHTCAPLIQPDHTSAPLIQPDHTSAQHTSEIPMDVESTSDSVYNQNESSSSVFCRSPSPKRLRGDCDKCVNHQRTAMNVDKKNDALELKISTLKRDHKKELRENSVKKLNQTISRKTVSASKWKGKKSELRQQLADMEKEKNVLPKKREEKNKQFMDRISELEKLLEKTNNENVVLKTKLCKVTDSKLQKIFLR